LPLFIPRNPRQPSPLALCTQVLHKFSVELPKKHGRGGQSALRFARLRLEKRHNYVRKVAEAATQIFVPGGDRPNVAGLVLAGSAEFKNELSESDLFDPRLKAIVLAVVDVSYGKRNEGEKRKKGGKKKKPQWVPLPISRRGPGSHLGPHGDRSNGGHPTLEHAGGGRVGRRALGAAAPRAPPADRPRCRAHDPHSPSIL